MPAQRRWPSRLRRTALVIGGLLLPIWATDREGPLAPLELPAWAATRSAPASRPAGWTLSLAPTPRRWDGDGFREAFATAEKLVPLICLPDPVDFWQARGDGPTESKPYKHSRWQGVLLSPLTYNLSPVTYPLPLISLGESPQGDSPQGKGPVIHVPQHH